MKKLLLASVLFISTQMYAQNKVSVGAFKTIEIGSHVDVILVQDSANYISTQDKDFDVSTIKYKVENETLSWSFSGEIPDGNIIVGFSKIEKLLISGSCDVKSDVMIHANNFVVNKSGSGDLDLEVLAQRIEVNQSGSGDIEISGNTPKLSVNKSGSGEFKSYQLIASNVTANASGAGTVKVYASDTLSASAAGVGDILYVGKPKSVDVNIAGAGTVREVPFVEKSNGDTTRLKVGNKKIIILDDEEKEEASTDSLTTKKRTNKVKDIYKGFEIGVNGYTTNSNSFTVDKPYDYLNLNYGKSININLNLAEWHIKLYKNNIALTSGAGFEFNRYFFSKSNMSLMPTKDTVSALPFIVDFKKNILKSTYLTVPLLLQFNTGSNPKKAFHFAVGGFAGYRLGGKLKQEYSFAGNDFKAKTYNDFNLNPLKYGAMVRMGYKKVNVYATYALSEMFTSKTFGPALHPFSVGITLLPF